MYEEVDAVNWKSIGFLNVNIGECLNIFNFKRITVACIKN